MGRLIALLAIMAFAGAIAISFLFVKPLWGEVGELKNELDALKRILAEEKRAYEKVQKVVQAYEDIPSDSQEKLDTLVPKNFRSAQFIASLDDLSRKQALILTSVDVTRPERSPQDDPLKPRIIKFTANLSGRYSSLKSLLESLEKSSTLIDVTSLQFSVPERGDAFPFTLQAKLYTQPASK